MGLSKDSKSIKKKTKKKPNGRKSALLSHKKLSPTLTALSSKATRNLIRSHHILQKRLAQALENGEAEAAEALRDQIEAQGGLKRYQQASVNGQSKDRGGDSSKVLVEWLQEGLLVAQSKSPVEPRSPVRRIPQASGLPLFRLLEVGSLSTTNACSCSPLFRYGITRIDLHSQNPLVQQQDFMARPIPASDSDRFDCISLSLVLNYVPTPEGRGDMLRRTALFFRQNNSSGKGYAEFFPSLFLVLPAPCVTNSRYLDEERLGSIMGAVGYSLVKRKLSAKLAYYLWRHTAQKTQVIEVFKKVEVKKGGKRNNFAITLHTEDPVGATSIAA